MRTRRRRNDRNVDKSINLLLLHEGFVKREPHEDTAFELKHVDSSLLPSAIESVTTQLEEEILPESCYLRRSLLGSPDPTLPVVPPRRLWTWKESRVWPLVKKDTAEYVFCHTDRDRQNILVDPVTFKILKIFGKFSTGKRLDISPPTKSFPTRS